MARPDTKETAPPTGRVRRGRRRSPPLPRASSRNLRRLYEGISRALPLDGIFFLNPGCVEPAQKGYAWLAKADLADKYHFSLVRRVLNGVDLQGRVVVEIGSGRGGNCRYLACYTDARRVVGLDIDEGSVQFCRRVHRYGNVSFLRGEAERLPLCDAAVDVVLSIASAHCFHDFSGLLSEARRVLKPRGVFCLADAWGFEPLGLDWAARRKALDRSGFRIVSEEDLSEPVFQAVQRKDGLPQRLRALAALRTRELLHRIANSMELVGLHLAAAQCSYVLWRLQKR